MKKIEDSLFSDPEIETDTTNAIVGSATPTTTTLSCVQTLDSDIACDFDEGSPSER